jgi:hypothetical protein
VTEDVNWAIALGAIFELRLTLVARTVRTAEEFAVSLQAVPDDAAVAMAANGGQHMDGTLEAVEDIRLAFVRDLKGLVVLVAAVITLRHEWFAFLDPPLAGVS